jgi:hypothetical protein
MFETSVHESWRFQTAETKHLRKVKMNHVLKAWKEIVIRNKYIRTQHLQVLKFLQVNKKMTK